MNKVLKEQKRQANIELLKFGVDKAVTVITDPTFSLVTGFVLTNYLQNTPMGTISTPGGVVQKFNFWNAIFPFLGPTISEEVTTAGTQQVNVLTEDQANLLRGGLIAAVAAKAGVFTGISDLVKGIIK